MDYVNMYIVWPSEHTRLKHAIELEKTVPSIMADIYFQITENKWIILL